MLSNLSQQEQKFFIYVLKCEQQKYYVGRTTNPTIRILQHFQQQGSEWTKLYKPIEVIASFTKCSAYDEDKYTKIYMAKYGIENVRGGSYCSTDLNDSTIEFIRKEIDGAEDKCFHCEETGHFASECHLRKSQSSTSFVSSSNPSSQSSSSSSDYSLLDEIRCGRCKRIGHETSDCYASTILTEISTTTQIIDNNCYRCGRSGHFASECYAKTAVNYSRSAPYRNYSRNYSNTNNYGYYYYSSRYDNYSSDDDDDYFSEDDYYY